MIGSIPFGLSHAESGNMGLQPQGIPSNVALSVPGDAASIMGYYAPYDLYVTAPTGVSSPMITPFQINVTADGSALATLYASGTVIANTSFANNIVMHDNTSYSGYVNLTLKISSPNGVQVYHWDLNFMSPVTYISYEKAKEAVLKPGMSDTTVAGIAAAFILVTVLLYRIWLPGMRKRVKQVWIKMGPRRHV